MSSRLGILALAALCCPWLCQTAQHQGGATSKQNVTQDTGGQSHRATILLHTEERWGGMPDDIDTDRSITLHTEPNQVFSPTNSMWVEQVGTHPRVYFFHNFLTPAERAHMIRVAAPLMRRSSVVGQKGESVIDSIRTSYGMFIRRMSDPIIERIERRISLVTHVPISYQEDIQVLRYSVGQKYGAHYDSNGNTREPGPHYRQATFYMYLSDVEEGGETAFPHNSEWADPSIPAKLQAAGVQFSECAKGHVAAKPKAGDAALFYSFHPNLTMDEASMHTGCPVVKGIKWGAPVWIHQQEFEHAGFLEQQRKRAMGRVEYPPEPGMCDDRHKQCGTWAAAGECSKNPEYMTGAGAGDGIGMCTRSCGVCRTCNSGDITCINENRAKAGYLPLDRAEMEWLGVNWWLGSAPSPEL